MQIRLIVAAGLVLLLTGLVVGQDEILPPDNLDVDEVTRMLDRAEYYATECGRYRCPALDCFAARNLYVGLFNLRYNARFLAFWISKIPRFEENALANGRYEKVTAIYRRVDSLLSQGGATSSKDMPNCLFKLSPACGDVTGRPKPLDVWGDYVPEYAQVKFPDNGDPAKGTAANPGVWRAGLAEYSARVLASRVFLAAFPFPQLDASWIETDKSSFEGKEEAEVRYYVSRCCRTRLKLVIVRAGAGPLAQGDKEDNSETWKLEISRVGSPTVKAPSVPGDYEIRLYDPENRTIIAFASFSVR